MRGPFRFPVARAVRDVVRDVSPAEAVVAFARRELDLELAPWQLEVLELVLAGEEPNADLVCHVCGAPRSLDQHRCPNEECSDS